MLVTQENSSPISYFARSNLQNREFEGVGASEALKICNITVYYLCHQKNLHYSTTSTIFTVEETS